MPKLVIFDLGGVVFESPIARLVRVEQEHGILNFGLNRFLSSTKAWKKLETGNINAEEFCSAYDKEVSSAIEAGADQELIQKLRKISGAQIIEIIDIASMEPRKYFVQALLRLKRAGYSTAALTNNFKLKGPALSQMKNVQQLFDKIYESSKLGMRKPSPDIYRYVCTAMEVDPSECVFLDDIGGNLKPAKRLGMHTIRVSMQDKDGVRALQELETILHLQLLPTTLSSIVPSYVSPIEKFAEQYEAAFTIDDHVELLKMVSEKVTFLDPLIPHGKPLNTREKLQHYLKQANDVLKNVNQLIIEKSFDHSTTTGVLVLRWLHMACNSVTHSQFAFPGVSIITIKKHDKLSKYVVTSHEDFYDPRILIQQFKNAYKLRRKNRQSAVAKL